MCWNKEMHDKHNLSHLRQVWDIILIILLFLFSHYQPLYWQYNIYKATSLQSYTFTQLLSKVFLNKYNKTFSCNLTWNIMTKCIMKKNWTCYVLQHTALYFFLRLYFQNSPLVVHLPWQHWIFPVPSSHTTDNLPRCDDGKKLGSNPVMLLICAKKNVCIIIFRLNTCVNALTPLILSNCDFRFNNYNFISHNVKIFISHKYDYFSEFQFINHNCNYFYNTTQLC